MTENYEAKYRELFSRYEDLVRAYDAALRRSQPPPIVYHYHYTALASAPIYPTVIPWAQADDPTYRTICGPAAVAAGGATSVAFAVPASGGGA